jgi:hypothetical protein
MGYVSSELLGYGILDIALSFWVFLGIFLAFDRKSILGIWDICLFCFRDTGY